MVIWMEVTTDKYKLPVAVADSAQALAKMRGVKTDTVYSWYCHSKKGEKKEKYVRVEVEDD